MQEEDTSPCAIVSQGLRAMNARLHDLVCTIGAGGQRKVWTIKTTDLDCCKYEQPKQSQHDHSEN